MTTVWRARLSGDRILCGWTVGGRSTCDGELAVIGTTQFDGSREIQWPPFYLGQWGRQGPHGESLLTIADYQRDKLERGRAPFGRRERHFNMRTGQPDPDGRKVAIRGRWALPVIAPCPRRQRDGRLCGRLNLVDEATLDGTAATRIGFEMPSD